MKRIATMMVALGAMLLLASCGGEKPRQIDVDAKLVINMKDGKTTRASWEGENPDLPHNPEHLSPQELVREVVHLAWDDHNGVYGEFSVMDDMKDIENAKVKLPSFLVIDKQHSQGEPFLNETLILGSNVRLLRTGRNGDQDRIIGYIPKKVLREAYKEIKPAWDKGDYDEVYRLFEECYVAYPCTRAEWEELKAKGLN